MGKHETMLGSNNLATWSMAATALMQSLTRLASTSDANVVSEFCSGTEQ